jgi:hypothetical protein
MTNSPADGPPDAVLAPRGAVLALATLTCLAAVALDAPFLCRPQLWEDDFGVVARSLTWQRTVDGLWVPQNEHAMPLGRLLTFILVRLSGGPAGLPRATSLVGPAAGVVAMWLVFAFVRRELGHPLYGLLAMTIFGVTSVYLQSVWWFSAAFVMPSVAFLLLALLAAQSWLRTGRRVDLALAVVAVALAPGWFAAGILAGPVVAVYLLPGNAARRTTVGWLGPLAVLAGSGLFLAVSLPRTGEAILHLEHYQGKTALQAFDPVAGLVASGRSVVDNLIPGLVGVGGLPWAVPLPLVPVLLGALAALGWWWWRPALRQEAPAAGVRLLPLGLALIGASYLLIYGARAAWGYEGVMTLLHWNRYHVLPQLGLAFLVCGPLPARMRVVPGRLTRRQARGAAALVVLSFLVQSPRAACCFPWTNPSQAELFRRLEQVDARCREYHVSAAAAEASLTKLDLTRWGSDDNGWELLRGSDDPHPRTPEEVRRLLEN